MVSRIGLVGWNYGMLAVMEAIFGAAASRRVLKVSPRCDRPAALGEAAAAALLA